MKKSSYLWPIYSVKRGKLEAKRSKMRLLNLLDKNRLFGTFVDPEPFEIYVHTVSHLKSLINV